MHHWLELYITINSISSSQNPLNEALGNQRPSFLPKTADQASLMGVCLSYSSVIGTCGYMSQIHRILYNRFAFQGLSGDVKRSW